MKRFFRYIPLLALVLCFAGVAGAQSTVDANIGFGAAQDKASPNGIDQNTFLSCNPAFDPNCSPTPSMNSFFMGFGANLMLWEHFGVGMEATLQPGKQDFATLPAIVSQGVLLQPATTIQSRVTFYDFNGIYQPIKRENASLQLIGGIGGVNMKFYQNFSSSNVFGNSNFSQYFSSANHFNLHAGIGAQVYLSGNIFVRPQFDIHYVPNFQQFGSNLVTQEMVWLGYTFGERQ